MIKMGKYSYAFQNYDSTRHVRAAMREKKISHKHAREITVAIKGLTIEKARDYLQSVVEHKRCIPFCLLYTSPSPRDKRQSRMPSSA